MNARQARAASHRMHSEHELYEGPVRISCGCVPFRRATDGSIEVMLISSARDHTALVLPKGGVNIGETETEGAARETYEEGGVAGTCGPVVHRHPWTRKDGGPERHAFFALNVTRVFLVWPEGRRSRHWLRVDDAINVIARPPQRDTLLIFKGMLQPLKLD